ncbi:MAG: hypothetical protein JWM11_1705 [Planctomycetaceae bacterium]|nr:hypothetical protein [Planctomycetaceae bacterium]
MGRRTNGSGVNVRQFRQTLELSIPFHHFGDEWLIAKLSMTPDPFSPACIEYLRPDARLGRNTTEISAGQISLVWTLLCVSCFFLFLYLVTPNRVLIPELHM